jgi:hypothetical protein
LKRGALALTRLGGIGELDLPLGVQVDHIDLIALGRLDGADPGDGLLRANSLNPLEDCDLAGEINPARAEPIPRRNVAR